MLTVLPDWIGGGAAATPSCHSKIQAAHGSAGDPAATCVTSVLRSTHLSVSSSSFRILGARPVAGRCRRNEGGAVSPVCSASMQCTLPPSPSFLALQTQAKNQLDAT
jgi:hypothetical protein